MLRLEIKKSIECNSEYIAQQQLKHYDFMTLLIALYSQSMSNSSEN